MLVILFCNGHLFHLFSLFTAVIVDNFIRSRDIFYSKTQESESVAESIKVGVCSVRNIHCSFLVLMAEGTNLIKPEIYVWQLCAISTVQSVFHDESFSL